MKIAKMIKSSALIASALILGTVQAQAVSATGTITQTVNAALAITNVSDLVFGSAAAGDVAKIVLPGTVENATNGSFNVTGQSGQAYTITLPADGTITLTTGAGGANETIAVNSFVSFPAAGANGLITGGTQLLLVGATRAALGASQVAGSYTGTYSVTVVY
ncbi:MAG: DUF4402 domain-containing protein [Pseudobdellovibrionaceae bacterium]